MKSVHLPHATGCAATATLQKRKIFSLTLLLGFLLPLFSLAQDRISVGGVVTDSAGVGIPQVTVAERGTKNATTTNSSGAFTINVANRQAVLVFSSVGYGVREVTVGDQASIAVSLVQTNTSLGEVVVVGYGTQRRGSITGAVSSVTSKDIGRVHGGGTVSSTLAGKIPGVTFRMPEGRPGASANIQIRNMGRPLYVIDGIQQDEGQFNNIAPNDIESITVLKDASAAIYGVRAANGVVVVTTKRGATGRNQINVDMYAGWQSWFRFPEVSNNSYEYMSYRADAEINRDGRTAITKEELEKYRQGESAGAAYKSFDWRKFILAKPAPQNQVNVNISGGSDKVSYYVSGTHFHQESMMGEEYKFDRSNIQSNVSAKLATGLRVGMDINGRVETRKNPGVPGGDDYWLARFGILRNTPLERPYANDNPAYLNDMGEHMESNYAFLNETISGKLKSEWRVIQTNFNAEWQIPAVPGLSLKGIYSYYMADLQHNNQEYTYKSYTYIPATATTPEEYKHTGGSTNPWRDREQIKQINTNMQGQLAYNNTFGDHTVGAVFVAERIQNNRRRNWLHASPISNNLPLIYFPTMDRYVDNESTESRIGYIGRINYGFANRYFLEVSARRDASYLFAPDKRVGYFPGVSVGWRISDEAFMKGITGGILSDLKLRVSYGELGDDRNPNDANLPIVAPYAYLEGYTYNPLVNPSDPNSDPLPPAILDGSSIIISRDKGIPTTNISWLTSKITDIGLDFGLLRGKLSGTLDYFYRKRSGLLGSKNDVVVPVEIGYSLPLENINSDAQFGGEMSLVYNNKVGDLAYNVGGNFSYSRSKFLSSYNPLFNNSWDRYRNSAENRYSRIEWGYIVDGQFQSQEEINSHPVDIDGQGNRTLLPGDLKYEDLNGDGRISEYDQRPIGFGYGQQPNINFGFTIGLIYKGFDFNADFSGASGYTWIQNWETRWAFQNNGNLNTIFTDRWHREDPYNQNSAWIPGRYPANRFNNGDHSNYNRNSTYWTHNIKQLRARTIQLGYTVPASYIQRIRLQRARVYLNAFNLFSIDNLKEFGVDPEVVDDNGLQFPQSRVLNVGINLTF
jgi:TonB-linked SusC/RagA family outer membrane protein